MGCGGSKMVTYQHGMEKRTIPMRDALNLEKWTLGAAARIKVLNMKRKYMKEITNLQKPCLKDGKLSSDPDPKKVLFPQKEFTEFQKGDAKKYMWDNYAEQISTTDKRIYRGGRLKKHMKTWEGIGTLKDEAAGTTYQGFTLKQKYHGRGRLTTKTGVVYQGDWLAGKKHGNGVIVSPEGKSMYDGAWEKDMKHGKGTETWILSTGQEAKYVGAFAQDKQTGKGIMTTSDKSIHYIGEFKDGEYHGEGQYVAGDCKYEGTFKNGKFVKGKQMMNDGSWYEGGYLNFKQHGEGSLHLANSNVYVGGFENDLRHGMGYLFDFETESKVREEWVKGKRKNFVKTPSTNKELQSQLQNEGYYFQGQGGALKNVVAKKPAVKKGANFNKALNSMTTVNRFKTQANFQASQMSSQMMSSPMK